MPQQLSVFDLSELAADVGPNPRTIGMLVELAGPAPCVADVRAAIGSRLGLVPRLGQRMRRVPFGAGRPVWEDVPVDLVHHVRTRTADASGLLDLTAAILTEPLDPARPWWTLTVVDVPSAGTSALVWSSHHAMADGPGLLQALLTVAGEGPARPRGEPEAVPGRAALTRAAWSARARSLRGLAHLPRYVVGLRELTASTPRRSPRSPLNRPISAGYLLRTVEVELAPLLDGARSCGATVNDALLWAWGGALHRRIAAAAGAGAGAGAGASPRGRRVAPVVVSCTVTTPSAEVGNRVGVILVPVPAPGGTVADDLGAIARDTRRRKRRITGTTWWAMAQLSRLLGAAGGYRRFLERQRTITSLLTNMRGPVDPLRVLGRTVTRVVPVSMLVGNVTLLVAALSYGGRLVVTVLCAPESAADLDVLVADLREGLGAVAALGPTRRSATCPQADSNCQPTD